MSKINDFIFKHFVQPGLDKVNKSVPDVVKSDRASSGSSMYGYSSDGLKQEEFLKSIRGWTYANINAIAEQMAFIKIKLYERKNKTIQEVEDHVLLDMLNKVNEYTTFFDQMWLTSTYLEAVGEAPWFLDKNDNNEIMGIYMLDPSKLTPVVSDDNKSLISGYKYRIKKGKVISIPVDQVILIKIPDPENPIRGLGTMQAAARAIDIDNASEAWNFQFFKNNATPGVKFNVNTKNLTPEQKKKIKDNIKNQYQGVEKSQQLWVLFDGMDVEPFGTAPKDMDFKGQAMWYADKIRGIFRVPKAMLAQTEGVNLASAKVSERVFIENVIKPKMERIVQQLNEFYITQFDGTENMFLDFDDPVSEDLEAKLKTYDNGLKNGWLTINEVRQQEGLEGIGKEGDIPYINISLKPVGYVPEPRQLQMKQNRLRYLKTKKDKNGIDKEVIVSDLTKKIKVELIKKIGKSKEKKEEVSEPWSKEKKDKFWQAKSVVFEEFKPKMKAKMNDAFNQQEKQVKADLKSSKDYETKVKPSDLFLNKKAEQKRLLGLFTPTIELLMQDSGDETFEFLGVAGSLDVDSEAVQSFIKSRTIKFADATTKTTNEAIKTAIGEGITEGESTSQLSKRISNIFGEARNYRSDRVAVSETTRFNVEATEQSFIDSGVVEAKEWIVNPGNCPYCAEFEGKIVGLGNSFAKKGDVIGGAGVPDIDLSYETIQNPPLHVSCACDLVPVLIPLKGMKLTKADKNVIRLKKESIQKDNEYKEELEHICKEHDHKIENVKKEAADEVMKKIEKIID